VVLAGPGVGGLADGPRGAGMAGWLAA